MEKNHSSLYSLLWIMLFDHTSLNIAFPVLTLLFFDLQSRLFHADTSSAMRSMWYGLAISVPHIINIFITPVLSGLSDEFGRKKILLVGTFGAFLFALTCAFGIVWGSLSLVFLGLIIRGAFSRTNPIAQAVIGDITESRQKIISMGYLQTAISLGAFIGPVLGGYFANRFFFNYFNFSLPYFLAAGFGAMSFILTLVLFKETLQKKSIHRWSEFNFRSIKHIFSHKKVLSISFILLLTQISWSLYYQFMPPILKTQLGFSANQLGLFVGMIAFWLALATAVGIKIIDQFFTFRQMFISSIYLILIGLILTLLFSFQETRSLVWLASIPTAIGDVISYSCLITLYSDAVEKHEQGKVMGVCFIVVSLIWALTGLLGGFLMSLLGFLPLIVAPMGIILAIVFIQTGMLKELLEREQ